jgi:cytochrome c oxidase assembly factor CtaG
MDMRHTLEEAVQAQGWVGGQIEFMALDQPETTIYPAFLRQWQIVDETIDDLIRENRELNDKLNKVIEAAR